MWADLLCLLSVRGSQHRQLCWFWLDETCSTLYWDLDESGMGRESSEGEGGSLALENIDDIIPLGAGPDQVLLTQSSRSPSGFMLNRHLNSSC